MEVNSARNASGQKRKYVAGLDIVRFLSALMVMMYHIFFWKNGNISSRSADAGTIWWFGWIGVEIFFVISGYVIAYSAQYSTPGHFAKSRLLRLAPTVWICATITLATMLMLGADLTHPLILRYFSTLVLRPVGDHIDIVYWTLTVEVAFYFFVYLVLRFASFAALEPLMIAIGTASSIFIVVLNTRLLAWLPHGAASLIVALSRMQTSRLLLLQHGCLFALGVLLWKLTQKSATIGSYLIAAFFAVTCTLEVHYAALQYIDEKAVHQVFPYSPLIAWGASLSLIVIFILKKDSFQFRSKRMNSTLRFLGLMTFPLYLIHNNVGVMIENRLLAMSVPSGMSQCAAVLCSLGLSALVVVVLEPPLKGLLKTAIEKATRTRPGETVIPVDVRE